MSTVLDDPGAQRLAVLVLLASAILWTAGGNRARRLMAVSGGRKEIC